MPSEFTGLADTLSTPEEDSTARGLAVASQFASSRNPASAAEAFKYAQERGVNFELAEEIQAQPTPKVDETWAGLEREAPTLARTLQDLAHAAAMKDDVKNLSLFERFFRGWKDIGYGTAQAYQSGTRTIELGRLGFKKANGLATPEDLRRIGQLQEEEDSNQELKFGYLSGIVPSTAQAVAQMADPWSRDPEKVWGTAFTGALTGAAAGSLAGGVGAAPGAFTGFLGGAAAATTALSTYNNAMAEAGNAFLEYEKIPGVNREAAAGAANLVGILNGGIELVAIDKILGLVPMARDFVGGAARSALREALKDQTKRAAIMKVAGAIAAKGLVEGLQEAAQEFVTIFEGIRVRPDEPGSWQALKESFSPQNRARIGESFEGGAQMGLGMAGIPAAAQLHSRLAQARQAETWGGFYKALGEAASGSRTRERLPTVFRAFVDNVQRDAGGPVESVKVPASQLRTLFQKEDITEAEVEKEMPEVARQLREAQEQGTPDLEVAVPIADMAAKIAPLSGYASIHEDLRIGDGLTIRESRQVMQEAENLYNANKEGQAEATPRQRVAADMASKLEAAGYHPKIARVQAALWAAFAEARAVRTGAKDAWDYYEKQKVEIQHADQVAAGDNQLAQTLSDSTGVRGAVSFDNARTLFRITLTGKANLSTFLHESGHSFIEMLRRDAAGGHAESQADLAALAEFSGAQGDTWTTESLEKLARAFEKYLAEGEAPSNRLEAVFRSMKDWFVMVYRSLTGLGVELTDDVRGVFNRMLATEDEITERARVTGLTMPDFAEVNGGIFSSAEYARLKASWDDSVAAMKEALLARSLKAQREIAEEERVRVEREVSAELNADPVQNLYAWLKDGQRLDDAQVDLEHGKLPAQAVRDAPITDEERKKLRRLTTEDFATSADEVAPYFGFDSGADMIVALARREPLRVARARMVAERLALLYPEGTVEHVTEAAKQAVTDQLSGRLGRVLEAELDAVGAKVGGEKGRVVLAAIRQAARRAARGMSLIEADVAKYSRAAQRAAKDYIDALAKGDAIAAFQAKRSQAWALEMYRAVSEAQAEGNRIAKYLDSFDDMPKRTRLMKAGGNYLSAIDALLEGIDFKRRTGRTLQKRADLAAYLAEMEAEGETVNIPLEARAEALKKNYRQMTLDELLGVEAAVSNLESLARLKNKLTGIQAARRLESTAQEAADHIHENWTVKGKPALLPGFGEQVSRRVASIKGQLSKVEFLLRALDGGKTAGLMNQLIFQPIARAETAKMEWLGKVLEELRRPFDAMNMEERRRLHRRVDFLGESMPFSSVLAVALNWGTESNRDKLIRGMAGRKVAWTEEAIQKRLDELMTEKDWQLVSHVWKTIDSLFPRIAELAKRAVGVEVEKVQGIPIQTKWGTVQGNYYPLVYDKDQPAPRSERGFTLKGPDEIAEMKGAPLFENNFMAPGGLVEKGFTQSRTKYAAPIKLSLSVVPAHVSEVIHYLTHFEAVRDVDKLLRQDNVRSAIQDALGVEGYRQFRPWLQSVANAGRADALAMFYESWLRKARLGSSIVMLGGKLTTGLVQALGIFPTLKEVKAKHVLEGMNRFLRKGFSEAREMSPGFKYQEEHFDRDIGVLYDRMASTLGEVGHLKDRVAQFALSWIKLVQGSVNAVTWYAARAQAEAEGHKDPVAYADSTVRMTQSSGAVKDLAWIQRGGETQKLFTVMYTYFSTLFNQLTEPIPDTKTGRQKAATYAARWWWAVMLPVLVEAMLRGKKPDRGDEPEDWATFLLKEQLLYSARTIPLVGDLTQAGLSGKTPRGNPWLTTMYNGAKAAGGVVDSDPLTESEKRAILDAIGAITSTPTTGLRNAYRYLDQLTNGNMQEPVRDLLFRSPGEWK